MDLKFKYAVLELNKYEHSFLEAKIKHYNRRHKYISLLYLYENEVKILNKIVTSDSYDKLAKYIRIYKCWEDHIIYTTRYFKKFGYLNQNT